MSCDCDNPENSDESSYTNSSNTATPSTHSPVTSKYESGDISSCDEHDGESPESPVTVGSLNATCIQSTGLAPLVNVLRILTVTDSFGSNVNTINTSLGSGSVGSSFDNITPWVYLTQNGSNVVGAALGDADG